MTRAALLLLLLPIHSALSASPVTIDRLKASVNTAIILASDVAKFRQTLGLRAQLDPLFSGTVLAAKGAGASDADIIDHLINDKIILQQFPVTEAEAEQEVNSIQAQNRIDRQKLRAALKEQGFSFDDYFELIRLSAAKRNLIDRDIRTKVSISDDDVKNHYYNQLAGKTGARLSYQVQMITISPSNYKSPTAAQDAARRALQAIKAGESFSEVARRMSDDPTASSGGELGSLTEDQMAPAIRKELKKLKVGETSGVLGDLKSRLFILKLTDMSSGDDSDFGRIKEEIRNQLAAAEYERQIQLWLERQGQIAFIHRAAS